MHISAKCSIAIHCLIFVYEYGERQKVTSDLLSRSTGSNPVTIRTILSALKKAGILAVRLGQEVQLFSVPRKRLHYTKFARQWNRVSLPNVLVFIPCHLKSVRWGEPFIAFWIVPIKRF